MEYTNEIVDFRTNNTSIDYFQIPIDKLQEDGYSVNHTLLNLEKGKYLDKVDVINSKEYPTTTILNIQAGKGKSTVIYDLVEQYVKAGKTVIVASPYRKLVDKDYAHLSERKLNVSHYQKTLESNFTKYAEIPDYDVHIMTINCLLQNPGEDAFDQCAAKKDYLNFILESIKRSKKKCVLIFDEIHAGINNFNKRYSPNLYVWKGIVDYCFLSSATFTSATYPVIKLIAGLTNKKISVVEGHRIQDTAKSELHFYITDRRYSGNNIEPILYLKEILTMHQGENVNVLTGTKSIAENLVKYSQTNVEFGEVFNSFDFNLVIGNTNSSFNDNGSNLGTTFSTGINLIDSQSTMVIIIPSIYQYGSYGIFSDGYNSIIQAIARVRHSGKIYVILPKPNVLLANSADLASLKSVPTDNEHFDQNQSFDILVRNYLHRKQEREFALTTLKQSVIGFKSETLEEYLLGSNNLIVKNYYSFGKQLSPYLLWAALNNQFVNASLSTITFVKHKRDYVKISESDAVGTIHRKFGNDIFDVLDSNLHDATINFLEKLRRYSETIILYNSTQIKPSEILRFPELLRIFINAIAELHIGKAIELSCEDYVFGNVIQAEFEYMSNEKEPINPRINAYIKLAKVRDEFIQLINKHIYKWQGEQLVPANMYEYITNLNLESWNAVICEINSTDILLKQRAFRFIPLSKPVQCNNESKKAIYNRLAHCFTNINISSRKPGPNGEKQGGRLIYGDLAKPISNTTADLPFI